MYFMYVDESGDPGPYDIHKPKRLRASRHFIVSGVIVPAAEWRNYLTALIDIRRNIKVTYGLPVRVELHGTRLINPRGDARYSLIGSRKTRVQLYRDALQLIAARLPQIRIINVHLDKLHPRSTAALAGRDPDEVAWERIIQRFNTYLQRSCQGALGMVFADQTNEVKMRRLLRKIRKHNLVPSHFGGFYAAPVTNIIEDPVMRNSENSYFVQIADITAHALYRLLYRKGSYRYLNIDRLFDLLDCVLLKVASPRDPRGIVHI